MSNGDNTLYDCEFLGVGRELAREVGMVRLNKNPQWSGKVQKE